MAITKISDVIVPELFNPYVINRTMELSEFFKSGIVVNSPEFDVLASEAARTHNMPFFEDLQGESEAILEDVKMTAKKIGSNEDVSTTIFRQNMWGATNLSAALAGADPMKAIGDLVASYWARDMQKELIAILTGVFGIATMVVGGIGAGFSSSVMLGISAVLAAFTVGGGILLGQGCSSLTSLSRRNKYIKALGTHTYCNFQQLAQAVGKPVKFVKKDIKRMISKGWFLQGHVDKQETCLITSNETYDQYVSTQKRLEERNHQQDEERARQEAALRQQAEEKERQKFNQHEQADARACVEAERDAAERIRLSPEVRQVLDKGNDFLDKIHRSNDAIPGEEISRKISRMELIIAKIFERAKAHPEIIPDLNRLMDYYLPMTVKLLNAYEEMDSQPVQGENITSSKKEIEETIDTLNVAFEKLLDSIFEDTAMDVSSDISVLNTVLAQEGLTEDELTRMRKEAEKNRL